MTPRPTTISLTSATRRAPARAVAASALLFCAASLAGCQKEDTFVPADIQEAGSTRVPVQPGWRAYAMDHYRGELLADLRAASDVRFLEPPTITASRNLESAIDLTVIGQLDVNDVTGTRYRRPYVVAWRRAGGGWEPSLRRIEPGKPAPLDTDAPRERPQVISPTTAPGTVSDPTAAPLGGPPVAPPPDAGGSPIPTDLAPPGAP